MADQSTPVRGAELRAKGSEKITESRDASLEFKITPDNMAAFVSSYTPAQGNGSPLSIELMESELRRAGYEGLLDTDGAKFALKRAEEGKSILNVALVRASYPQNAEDGHISTDADLNFPVLPGMEFGMLSKAVPSASGTNLVGDKIPAEDTHTPKTLTVAANGNCIHNSNTGALISEQYGIVVIEENEIHVKLLISVSQNEMQVKAMLYPHDCFGMKYDLSSIAPALEGMNIARPIQHLAGQQAIQTSRETGMVQEAVIVQGTEPVPGKDGFFEYAKENSGTSIGTTDEGDRMDFKNRGVHPMVAPGDIIGKIHPPVEGQAGEDVYGKLTPPPGGNPFEVKPGSHVAPMSDGITYKATATGIVHLSEGKLSVKDVLTTKGDVDYSTGNITLEKGSVHVTGSIREGFAVEVPDHIVVQDSIEGATVTTGGDIEVKGGLVMGGKGAIKSGGTITAQFAANAHIECGDELIITNEINNCFINCKGTVLAHGGKGIIQGGTIISETGIEAKELGSDIGVKTVVGIRSKQPVNRKMIHERDSLRDRLLKINTTVGEAPDTMILEATPEAKRPQMEQVLLMRGRIKMRLREIRKKLSNDLAEYYKSLEMLSIRVHRKVYPGVEIKIGGKTVQVSKPINRMKFRFDADERTIVAVKF
ncbi:DUF342 domain-containing protein [Maridesulfovibrio zosterae]|uniref:DUF342 domain-containing protein n=1 Tax=Maridesulfovibrio zosterae TaxID=82171 RepID=UPI00040FF413|nr:FapA family protein [Maridesulfovibrio zosterae]